MTTAPASPIGQELASPGSLRAAVMDTCNGESTFHVSESAVLGDKIVISCWVWCLLCDCAEILHCELILSLPSEVSPIITLLTHVRPVVTLPVASVLLPFSEAEPQAS